jgi:adenylosuccinate lyase
VLRNLGAVWGYLAIGLKSLLKGLDKIEINVEMLDRDLEANPELLAEAIQTAMRIYKEENPYEKLKDLTRGRRITPADIRRFVDDLEKVPDELKNRMKAMTTREYTGLSEKLVDHYFSKI